MIELLITGLFVFSSVPEKIRSLSPTVSSSTILGVQSGLKSCKDINLTLAIIKVESDFRISAVNKHSNDYGIMQINDWHVKRYKYSRKKLISDIKYNMSIGCSILDELTRKHDLLESVSRYNCGYRRGCKDWTSVKKYVKRVLRYKRRLDLIDLK